MNMELNEQEELQEQNNLEQSQPKTVTTLQKMIDKIPSATPTTKEDFVRVCANYLKNSLSSKITEEQAQEFIYICYLNKLNPWKREAYAVPYGNKFQVITGYQVYIQRAEQTKLLEYWNVDIQTKQDQHGNLVPQIGTFTCKRKDQTQPMKFSFIFNEWKQNQGLWGSKPYFMFEKTIIANGFRKAFSVELGSLPYTQEEIWFFNQETPKHFEAQNKAIEKLEQAVEEGKEVVF